MDDETKQRQENWLARADILTEALPYMRRHAGKVVVVKYGGHAMGDAALSSAFARDIVLMRQVGINVIVVHGGGPQIGAMLDRVGVESEFIDGLRVTTSEAVDVVEMVLSGQVNKSIVAQIASEGGRAVGLSGKDGGLLRVKKLTRTKKDPDSNIEKVIDLGFVGEPDQIDPYILEAMSEKSIIPVVAPIGWDAEGNTYNVNADTAAGAIAGALKASRLLMLTDVSGVLDKSGDLMQELSIADCKALQEDGTLSGGMIPKVENCIDAVNRGVEGAVIIDGRVPHGVLLELFTEHGSGTLIRR
jgi:acetylglutamate kinase